MEGENKTYSNDGQINQMAENAKAERKRSTAGEEMNKLAASF